MIYPQFEECSAYTLDPWWKNIFLKCAMGNFPQKVKFDGESKLIILQEEVVLGDSPRENFLLIKDKFQNLLGLWSPRFLENKNDEFRQISDIIKSQRIEDDWKKIKPKNIRDKLIFDFVKNFSSDPREIKEMIVTISTGFQFKQIVADDIVLKDQKIEKIKNLEFDEDIRTFVFTRRQKSTAKKTISKEKDSLLTYTNNYIRNYKSQQRID